MEHLDLYFQACSLTATCRTMAAIAATLANHGKSPVSGETILEPEIVMDALSIMFMCGMYDFSGQFAFSIGLPAKSGVAGALLIVIPNVGGICTWSPRLDELGNSVRGVAFCNELAKRTKYAYHIFRTLNNVKNGKDVEDENDVTTIRSMETFTHRIIHACSINDIDAVEKLVNYGIDKFRKSNESVEDVAKRLVDSADYDRRTCVHLAAAEGHEDVLNFLISHGATIHPKDRWGNTPVHEVRKAIKHLDQLHSAVGFIPTADEINLRDRYKKIFFKLAVEETTPDDNSSMRSRANSAVNEWQALSRSNSIDDIPGLADAKRVPGNNLTPISELKVPTPSAMPQDSNSRSSNEHYNEKHSNEARIGQPDSSRTPHRLSMVNQPHFEVKST